MSGRYLVTSQKSDKYQAFYDTNTIGFQPSFRPSNDTFEFGRCRQHYETIHYSISFRTLFGSEASAFWLVLVPNWTDDGGKHALKNRVVQFTVHILREKTE